MIAFYVGQKVVCIDADNTNSWGLQELIKDTTYTLSWLGTATECDILDVLSDPVPQEERTLQVRLTEVKRPTYYCGCHKRGVEFTFSSTRFRPLDERKTDISVFKGLLQPVTVGSDG